MATVKLNDDASQHTTTSSASAAALESLPAELLAKVYTFLPFCQQLGLSTLCKSLCKAVLNSLTRVAFCLDSSTSLSDVLRLFPAVHKLFLVVHADKHKDDEEIRVDKGNFIFSKYTEDLLLTEEKARSPRDTPARCTGKRAHPFACCSPVHGSMISLRLVCCK